MTSPPRLAIREDGSPKSDGQSTKSGGTRSALLRGRVRQRRNDSRVRVNATSDVEPEEARAAAEDGRAPRAGTRTSRRRHARPHEQWTSAPKGGCARIAVGCARESRTRDRRPRPFWTANEETELPLHLPSPLPPCGRTVQLTRADPPRIGRNARIMQFFCFRHNAQWLFYGDKYTFWVGFPTHCHWIIGRRGQIFQLNDCALRETAGLVHLPSELLERNAPMVGACDHAAAGR
jgi:hypothetical protein